MTGTIKLDSLEFDVGKWGFSVRKGIVGEDMTDDKHDKNDIGVRTREVSLQRIDLDDYASYKTMIQLLESNEKLDLEIRYDGEHPISFDGSDSPTNEVMPVQIESYDLAKERGIEAKFVINFIKLIQAGNLKNSS